MTIPYIPSAAAAAKIVDFSRWCTTQMQGNWNLRPRLEEIDKRYAREMHRNLEQYKAEQANRLKDPLKFQNVEIPVIMPQVESAVAYQHSVFLTGHPVFSVVSHPEFAAQASQVDTIFAEQEYRGQWKSEILKCFRDGFKYNLMAMEVSWEQEATVSLETDMAYRNGQEGKARELMWEGNKLRRLNLYNTFWDVRVEPKDVAEFGEYAGYHQLLGRVAYKKFIHKLPTRINIAESLKAGTVGGAAAGNYDSYYFPQINPTAFVNNAQAGFNWAGWAGYERPAGIGECNDAYLVTTLYARIIPADMGITNVPGPKTPQVWKFIIVNGATIIYAERCTNAHDMIPIVFGQPLDDGLGYQTKSFAQNVEPFQALTTALANSSIASRRRAISDRKVFDPSRISPAALNNDSPTANIPVRPSAYGRNVSEAVYAFPFRDDQFQINMQEIQSYLQMANNVSGLNPARQGQFVKGNKTRFEYADVMANANGRDQVISAIIEESFLAPIKRMLLINVLQYQKSGAVTDPATGNSVKVDPVVLRKASLVMKVTDGLSPSDKLIDGETLSSAIQLFTQNPEFGREYNLGDMAAYLFESRGLKLKTYKKSAEQVAYEDAMGQWQQAVAALAQELTKNKELDVQELAEALQQLPQPTPEQFGFNPGQKVLTPGAATTPNGEGILSEITTVIKNAQESMQAQQAQAQAAPAEGE